jgi:hypothetical protein
MSRRFLASLLAMSLVAGVSPTVAVASWTAPVTLSATGADDPQVAVDSDGDAAFTWVRPDGTQYRIQARVRSAAGALSPILNLSAAGQPGAPRDAFQPQVAVDAAGNAIFTWSRFDGTNSRIQARVRSAGGVLGPVLNLSAAGQNANSPQVAVDGSGSAIFTWSRFDGTNSRIQARKRGSGGVLGPVETLSAAGQSAGDPQVAVDNNGNATFTWVRSDGTNGRIQARRRAVNGVLSPIQTLSVPGHNALVPQVGMKEQAPSDAVFTWEFDDNPYRIQGRARSASGALGQILNLSAPGQTAADPQVAVDPAGNAIFTWTRFDGSSPNPPFCCYRVQARKRSASGALGQILDLSAAGQNAGGGPQVALDGVGNAMFAWSRSDGSSPLPDPCCTRVQVRPRSAGGALGSVETLSAAGEDGGFQQVAVNDAGDAIATWAFRSDGTSFVIQAAAGP